MLRLPDHIATPPIPEDNPMSRAGIQLGRHLFYDPILSGNNTQSCADCHQQDKGFTDGRALAIGAEGKEAKRNTMALINLAWSKALMWDGRAPDLETQALIPILDPLEMNQPMDELIGELEDHPDYPARFQAAFPDAPISDTLIARALAQFVRTLVSFDSPLDRLAPEDGQGVELTAQQTRGSALLTERLPKGNPQGILDMCNTCHDQYQGLQDPDAEGNHDLRGLFNGPGLAHNGLPGATAPSVIPTIRNIAVTGPYMHDGRFETLTEVLQHYNDHMQDAELLDPRLRGLDGPLRLGLSDEDIVDVVALLELFTDESFLTDPTLGPPAEGAP